MSPSTSLRSEAFFRVTITGFLPTSTPAALGLGRSAGSCSLTGLGAAVPPSRPRCAAVGSCQPLGTQLSPLFPHALTWHSLAENSFAYDRSHPPEKTGCQWLLLPAYNERPLYHSANAAPAVLSWSADKPRCAQQTGSVCLPAGARSSGWERKPGQRQGCSGRRHCSVNDTPPHLGVWTVLHKLLSDVTVSFKFQLNFKHEDVYRQLGNSC